MKEYIKELRSFVGQRPILMCVASVIIFDQQERVLMLHRSDNNSWCFPGGAVELGEKVEEAAKREVFEETGFIIDSLELLGVFSGPELYYKYPNGDEVYNVDIVFTARSYHGQFRTNDESKNGEFIRVDEMPDEISPPVIPIVRELKKRLSAVLKK